MEWLIPVEAGANIIDGAAFRQSMRFPASGVTVIASGTGNERVGLTATAVCSLSDDPPSLLACVNKKSHALETILRTGNFSVNFLHPDQIDVASIFAGRTDLRGNDRFQPKAWTTLLSGAPVLKASLASFDCHLSHHIDYATHSILIGHVASTLHSGNTEMLLYAQGRFIDAAT